MSETALHTILDYAREGAALRESFLTQAAPTINALGLHVAHTIATGKKLLLCGNGGSAADCQHIAAEFMNRFQLDRPPLPAVALTTDSSIITSIGNDFSFDQIFSKQVQGLGTQGDMLLAISTSGNSPNVLAAVTAAKEKGMFVVGLAGKDGGALAQLCHACLTVPHANTALVQELHITIGHLLCLLADHYLFQNVAALGPYLEGSLPLPLPQ